MTSTLEVDMQENLSLLFSLLSVILGFISIGLTLSVKKAVALTEKQIYLQNLKLDLSIKIATITNECTEKNIRDLYGLLQGIYTNTKLPNHLKVKSSLDSLADFLKHSLYTNDRQLPDNVVEKYLRAHSEAEVFIKNIDTRNP